MDKAEVTLWGLQAHGVPLFVNDHIPNPGTWAIDVETDEKDNFVGLAVKPLHVNEVCYFTSFTDTLKSYLERSRLIGHNLKSDIHWLKSWGINLSGKSIFHDTMILAYSDDCTQDSYGLKTLAGNLLQFVWPTYKEMVGTGRKRTTLDKQDIEQVANYCGMDALATEGLFKYYLSKGIGPAYTNIELPIYKLLCDVEAKGIKVNVEYLKEVDNRLLEQNQVCLEWLQKYALEKGHSKFNPASPKQVLEVLFTSLGIKEDKTAVDVLQRYAEQYEPIRKLLEFRQIAKVQGTYTGAFLALPSMPYIHCKFNQVAYGDGGADSKGIRTTRLSSSDPNLQNIPAKGECGPIVRRAFIPREQKVFICADYSQIEYRLLAHYTKEPVLIKAFKEGIDVHSQTARIILEIEDGEELTDDQRRIGKTINFASIYGAKEKKIAVTTGRSEEECKKFLQVYFQRLPYTGAWINRVKTEAHFKKGVRTLFGRWIALPGIVSANKYERFHWERAAVNYIIQGSAAEIMKIAMLRLAEVNLVPLLTVHDELVFEVEDNNQILRNTSGWIRDIMEHVVDLAVPLEVSLGVGPNWEDAKHG